MCKHRLVLHMSSSPCAESFSVIIIIVIAIIIVTVIIIIINIVIIIVIIIIIIIIIVIIMIPIMITIMITIMFIVVIIITTGGTSNAKPFAWQMMGKRLLSTARRPLLCCGAACMAQSTWTLQASANGRQLRYTTLLLLQANSVC